MRRNILLVLAFLLLAFTLLYACPEAPAGATPAPDCMARDSSGQELLSVACE